MTLVSDAQLGRLLANGRAQREAQGGDDCLDLFPVVKLFVPGTGMIWLLSEVNPDDQQLAFGLCDLGLGEPELGYVDLVELSALRVPRAIRITVDGNPERVIRGSIQVECDRVWLPSKTLSQYAEAARQGRRIIA